MDWTTLPMKKNVPLNKEWTITFNKDVEVGSITNKHLYITDEAGQVVQTTAMLVDKGNKVIVQPPKEGYRPNTSYTLFVADEVSSTKRKLLSAPVKMPFQTGDQRDESDVFVPRNDSENAVTYQEGVTSLPSNISQSIEDWNYEDNTFVFKGMPEVLKRLSAGDIIIFPETKRYPLGWSKEIVDINYDGNQTVMTTKEPKLEDVIKDIDMSNALAITSDDFTLDPELESRVVSETKSGDIRTFEVENLSDASIGEIKIGSEKSNPYIEFSDVQLLPAGADHGAATLGGKIELIKPMVNIDLQGLTVNWLELNSGLKTSLNVEFQVSSAESEPLKIPIGGSFPVKAYGLAGVSIQFFLQCEASGKVYIEFEVVKDEYYNLGVKKETDGYESFDHSTSDLSAEFLSMKGEVEGKVGAGPTVNAEILQFTLAGIDTLGGYKIKAAGEIEKDNMCFSIKDEYYIESSARIGKSEDTAWKVLISYLNKPIHQKSTCSLRKLTADPIVLKPGEKTELNIQGIDYKWKSNPMTLPDSSIVLKVKDQNVASVNYLGEVRAKTTAKSGDRTFITITYDNGRDAIVEATIPVQIAESISLEEMRSMVETVGPDIRKILEKAEIVNGAYKDFSHIENDLKKLVTSNYLEGLRDYYEEFMHPTVDISLFAERVSTVLKFDVIESSPEKLILQTVVPNIGLSSGTNAIYTFVKEDDKWLLDAVDSKSFIDSPMNPSLDQIQEYLQQAYSENSADVQTEFVSSGTESIYYQPTDTYYDRKYYIFTIETIWDQFTIKFTTYDGSTVIIN
ncbi:Ig-like domain-containing protein [Sporosarcina sp. P37]|uniref:Ig-like domain-containing protein n=2 Tax=unclassified Sporosarcina TaxID=2647733 RepID=UPI0018DE8C64|nr:Ig-like domain-containing protein [Sporosarcina sp. P37]